METGVFRKCYDLKTDFEIITSVLKSRVKSSNNGFSKHNNGKNLIGYAFSATLKWRKTQV